MAPKRGLIEVAAPDGSVFLVGSGGFAREAGGPFSIVAYPKRDDLAYLRRPAYVEPVRGANAYFRRLDDLISGIREGTWQPPSLSEAEVARLRAQAAKREVRRAYAQEHPVRSLVMATAYFAAVVLFFVAVGVVGDLMSGREVTAPSPVRLAALVASWAALLAFMGRRNARRLGGRQTDHL